VRVLHVSGGQVYGGIERMLVTLASTASDDLTQLFAVAPTDRLWRELQERGVDPVMLPSPRASRPLSVLKARRAFDRQLAELAPDAAIFHGSWTHAMFAPVARDRGARVVFWQHAPILNRHWPDRWASWTAPDVLIANSLFTASAPAFPKALTRVIYCPVTAPPAIADEARTAGRAALGAREEDVVVLMAARLEMLKGHHILIDAAGQIQGTNAIVWIAGGVQRAEEQAYFDRVARAAAALRGRVRLLGNRADVTHLMQLADIYCQPNVAAESFGIAIAEAMRAARPCIVSDVGGPAELVDESCGMITAPGDTSGVAAAIAVLAGDPPRRLAMGRAAAVRAHRMTDPAGRVSELAELLAMEPAHGG
jgi:glycosyltransferase involved in cell wall biosynthesis